MSYKKLTVIINWSNFKTTLILHYFLNWAIQLFLFKDTKWCYSWNSEKSPLITKFNSCMQLLWENNSNYSLRLKILDSYITLGCRNIIGSFLFIVKIYFITNSNYTTKQHLINSCAKRNESNIFGQMEQREDYFCECV